MKIYLLKFCEKFSAIIRASSEDEAIFLAKNENISFDEIEEIAIDLPRSVVFQK
jgi:hypothetical protein